MTRGTERVGGELHRLGRRDRPAWQGEGHRREFAETLRAQGRELLFVE